MGGRPLAPCFISVCSGLMLGGCTPSNGEGATPASSIDGSIATDAGPDATTIDGPASPFIGAWTCTVTITDAESDGGNGVGSETWMITGSTGAEIRVSSSLLDGGFICAATSSISNGTATLTPNQSCDLSNGQNVELEGGTGTVSGNTLTFSETIVNGDGSFGPQNVSAVCTRQSVDGGSDGGLTTEADGSADAMVAEASFACVQPADPAPLVQDMNSCAASPTPAGGTIVNGTYYLTSALYYGGDAGCSQPLSGQSQGTIVVSGGEISIVAVNGENGMGWEVATNPNGACICGTFSSCTGVESGSPPTNYTATSTSIMLFDLPPNGVFTFTKQ